MRGNIAERFWQKVNKSGGCWVWTASTNGRGYGKFWNGERIVAAHRFSFELSGEPIPRGAFVLHRCDNPGCVRPDHLFLGTQAENIQDMINKQRHGYTGSPGERNHQAKLTRDQVAEIRRRFNDGETRADLAREFNLCWLTIDRIVQFQHWNEAA